MKTMQATDLRKTLFDELDHIASSGEPMQIVRFKKPIAMIVPMTNASRKPLLDLDAISEFCKKHEVKSFALFGSIMRDDFGPESDVDVLLDLGTKHSHSFITISKMRYELVEMFSRDVDIVIKGSLPHANPVRRQAIEQEAKVIYEA